MKTTAPLSPDLDALERRLLGINPGLIQTVERGETSPAIAAAVRQSPEWAQYRDELQSSPPSPVTDANLPPPLPMPAYLQALIRQRSDALALKHERIPATGQIVRVDQILTPQTGMLDAVLMAPLYVLLDAPCEEPALWHGWLLSGETDYASWWDAVLQEDEAHFDPEAGMVQLWNPVRLYLPMAARVVGLLSPAALQAVRALAAEFISTEPPQEIAPWPGRIAMRSTLDGLRVATGSPLSDERDPRHRYQDIYFAAAEAVREPARLAMQALASVPDTPRGDFLRKLVGNAARQLAQLLPQPRVAVAMSDQSAQTTAGNEPDLIWPELARLRLRSCDEKLRYGSLEVSAIGKVDLSVKVLRGDITEQQHPLSPGAQTLIDWDEHSTALQLCAADGRELKLELHDAPGHAD